ncbi:chromate transporter [Saccharicrinis aurantiacus]|uniref:chromate transporter n=1 Tax=Saccharicrinis aurantiacus TaxID=1849719 RepID=UPI00094FAF6A|nr:chromate transporter [Saccharicrinis aurantiacus]
MKDLFNLAISFFKIGLFNFGGGMAMIPLIIEELERNNWMTPDMFFDFFSLAQMTPGAIAMNTASYVGVGVAGLPGAVVATTFLAAPSIIVMLILSGILRRIKEHKLKTAIFAALKPVTVALILFAGYHIADQSFFENNYQNINYIAIALSAVCLLISTKVKKIHPILLIVLAGVAGIFLF